MAEAVEVIDQRSSPLGSDSYSSRRRGRQSRRPAPTASSQLSATRMQHNDGQTARGGLIGSHRDDPLALRPASVAPDGARTPRATSTSLSQHVQRASNTNSQLRGRGVRRPGGQRSHQGVDSFVTGRTFGGQLTNDDNEAITTSSGDNSLRPQANEFVPNGVPSQRNDNVLRSKQSQQPKRRASRSHAADISTRIHEDIENRLYECPICCSEVLRNSKVWSCHKCWTVFHLGCIKQWASNADKQESTQRSQVSDTQNWRCPGCNLPQESKPSSYACWCGKDHDPRHITGLPPHSCGQSCGKRRTLPSKCPHPCEIMCHAGPCPPCSRMGPPQSCFCGKESSTRKCSDTDYGSAWSCGQECGDHMPCGEHQCQRQCHEGLCGACEVDVPARCYCGKQNKTISCCDRDDEMESSRQHQTQDDQLATETWTGIFRCDTTCSRPFDCGKHSCAKPCHVQDELPTHCPRSPDLVRFCPCGKTSIEDILSRPRQSCEDNIPNCGLICAKRLSCGHECQQSCHSGECMPCMQTVEITCQCGRTTVRSICHQGKEEQPQCPRVCRISLNCGRHACDARCCPGEKKAVERQAQRRKGRHTASARDTLEFEAEHICTRTCGRTLSCGTHTCPELCHKGPCPSCREAVFDEVSCNCGRSVLMPPQPCGVQPPPCRFSCERIKQCGHPQVEHNCHLDAVKCPPCPFLVERPCLCGKRNLKNQQCSSKHPMCGAVCNELLRCGRHRCRKTCHLPGECEDTSAGRCHQQCGREKPTCRHPCEDQCHFFGCKEEKPCPHKIIVTCDCQLKKQEMRCNATKSSDGNLMKSLPCDDECARMERNRRLAIALEIPKDHEDEHIPYSMETLSIFQEFPKWAQDQEREFRVFATSEEEKRIRFKPMPARQRTFLHSLATDFGLDSESMDPEPHRHVAIFKTPRFVSAPTKTLRDCIRIRQNQRSVANTFSFTKEAGMQANQFLESYNGYLLTETRFALTDDEVHNVIQAVRSGSPSLDYDLESFFLASGDVALQLKSPVPESGLENTLRTLKPAIAAAFAQEKLGTLSLCRLDASMNVARVETDPADSGWSRVAAKAAAPKKLVPIQGIGTKSAFTVLGNLSSRKNDAKPTDATIQRKKAKSASIEEDWELAEEKAEAEEKKQELRHDTLNEAARSVSGEVSVDE